MSEAEKTQGRWQGGEQLTPSGLVGRRERGGDGESRQTTFHPDRVKVLEGRRGEERSRAGHPLHPLLGGLVPQPRWVLLKPCRGAGWASVWAEARAWDKGELFAWGFHTWGLTASPGAPDGTGHSSAATSPARRLERLQYGASSGPERAQATSSLSFVSPSGHRNPRHLGNKIYAQETTRIRLR